MTDEKKAIDLTSKSFELEKDKVEWFCSTYKNSRMSEIHTFHNGVLVGLTEGRKERNCVNCSNHGKQFEVMKLEKEIIKLKKAFYLFVDWMTECDIGYDNLEDSYIKYRDEIDEKKLNYIQSLIYTALKESETDDSNHLENKIKEFDILLEGGCK